MPLCPFWAYLPPFFTPNFRLQSLFCTPITLTSFKTSKDWCGPPQFWTNVNTSAISHQRAENWESKWAIVIIYPVNASDSPTKSECRNFEFFSVSYPPQKAEILVFFCFFNVPDKIRAYNFFKTTWWLENPTYYSSKEPKGGEASWVLHDAHNKIPGHWDSKPLGGLNELRPLYC